MPWHECSKVDERLRFVARLLEGEKMAVLCREFDISRKTGHKIFNRYQECGLEGLTDRSRRPYRQANRLPFQIEALILQLKKEHPTWGAPKAKRRYSDSPSLKAARSRGGLFYFTYRLLLRDVRLVI
jgi:putative transposase